MESIYFRSISLRSSITSRWGKTALTLQGLSNNRRRQKAMYRLEAQALPCRVLSDWIHCTELAHTEGIFEIADHVAIKQLKKLCLHVWVLFSCWFSVSNIFRTHRISIFDEYAFKTGEIFEHSFLPRMTVGANNPICFIALYMPASCSLLPYWASQN